MKPVTIYTRLLCSYSARAIKLLEQKKADFTEIDAGMSPELRAEMIQKSNGASTYPQIFIGDVHIGGCDDLFALEHSGKLDAALAA